MNDVRRWPPVPESVRGALKKSKDDIHALFSRIAEKLESELKTKFKVKSKLTSGRVGARSRGTSWSEEHIILDIILSSKEYGDIIAAFETQSQSLALAAGRTYRIQLRWKGFSDKIREHFDITAEKEKLSLGLTRTLYRPDDCQKWLNFIKSELDQMFAALHKNFNSKFGEKLIVELYQGY